MRFNQLITHSGESPYFFRPKSNANVIRDLEQQQRRRQWKCHLKTNICEMVITLCLLPFCRIFYCWQSTLLMDWLMRRWRKFRDRDLLLCVDVVVKTRLRQRIIILKCVCRTCSSIIFPYSTNQIILFWHRRCCCCPPYLNSPLRHLFETHCGHFLLLLLRNPTIL